MLNTLDHVVIAVRDIETATDTYARLLGRLPSWRGHHSQLGTANTLFRLENAYIELLGPTGEGQLAAELIRRIEGSGEGLLALSFGTDDAARCAATLRERGIGAVDPIEGEGRESTSGAVRRWRNVHLPEADTRGLTLFVIEHGSPPDALPVAEPLAPLGSTVSAIDHIVIMTPDATAACALYRDKLGLRLALERTFESRGLRLLFFRLGGVTVELAARLEAPSSPNEHDRLWGISYRVPDLIAVHERVAKAGFDVSEVRRGQRPGTLVCTVRAETHGVATLLIGPDGQAEKEAA